MDFYQDTSKRTLHLAGRSVHVINLEKTAAEVDGDIQGLPNSAFADPMSRRFPVHTPADVLISAAYAAMGGGKVAADVHRRIETHAVLWGINDTVKKIAEEIAAARLPGPVKYALDATVAGKPLRLFPYRSPGTLKEAVEAFYGNRHKLPWPMRQKTAQNVFREILGYGGNGEVKADPAAFAYVCKAAGYGYPSMPAAEQMLLERRNAKNAADPVFSKVAYILQEIVFAPDWAKTAMATFDAMDHELGLVAQYGKGVELPEEQLFEGTSALEKAASDVGVVHLMNGKSIRVADIEWAKVARFDPDLFRETGGGDHAKATAVLPTWPRPDADNLVDMLNLETVSA